MFDDINELYQSVILDHAAHPRNFGTIPGADRHAHGHNPLCGDDVVLYLKLNGDTIERCAFCGDGCAISKASASLLTETVAGKTIAEARELFHSFHALVTGKEEVSKDLAKLTVFSGVKQFPVRVKCASLAWHTLISALDEKSATVKTE